jgi:predicted DNA-binding transcriptional regulator YafY
MADSVIFAVSDQTEVVEFTYTNWKGETRQRQATLMNFFIGSNEWHKGLQWLVRGWDLEKKDYRTFALKDITNIKRAGHD